jgi:hypothetical protein
VSVTGLGTPIVGQIVQKSGATTCLTQGMIDGLGEYRDIAVAAEIDGVGPAFRIVPEASETAEFPLGLPGDSGALWFDAESGSALGLHVRGPDNLGGGDQYAIASLMSSIVTAFGVTIP